MNGIVAPAKAEAYLRGHDEMQEKPFFVEGSKNRVLRTRIHYDGFE